VYYPSDHKQPIGFGKSHGWPAWSALAVFALVSFSFMIGSYPLIDRDEALYSQVSRELLDHSDWWTLYWQGHPWFIHAPLSMWMQAAMFKAFGVSEWAARLPSVIFGTGLVMLTAALGAILYNRRTGLIAGLVMATSPIIYLISRMSILDMPFAFFITLSILLFVLAWRNGDRRLYPVFWLSVGLATLGKGLWGMALPLMVSFLYAVTDKNRRRLLDWRLYASAVAWAAVAGPWIVIGAQRHGREFLDPIFVTNTYARLTTSVCNHVGPWWIYLPIIVGGLLPWSVLWTRGFFSMKGDSGRLLVLWVVPGLLLHSIARTKLPNYVLPFVPALVLMLAAHIAEAKQKRSQAIALPIIAAVIALGASFGLRGVRDISLHPSPITLTAYMVAAYGLAGIALVRSKDRGVTVAAVCMMLVLTLIPFACVRVFPEVGPSLMAREARSIAGSGPVMTISNTPSHDGICFYSGRPFVQPDNMDALVRALAGQKGTCAVVLENRRMDELAKRVRIHEVRRTPRWVLAAVEGGAR
jgi:4-amino-4-deoxy-L-arabinose transferase-like glycosyltransferase